MFSNAEGLRRRVYLNYSEASVIRCISVFVGIRSKDGEVVVSFARSFQMSGAAALKAPAPVADPTRGTVGRVRSGGRSDRPRWYSFSVRDGDLKRQTCFRV